MDCFESRLDLNDRRFRVQTGSTTTSAAGDKFSASILLCDCEFGEDGIFSWTRAYIQRQSSVPVDMCRYWQFGTPHGSRDTLQVRCLLTSRILK